MLVWSRSGRLLAWSIGALVLLVIYAAPILVIAAASLANQWNGVFPTGLTLRHYANALSGESFGQVEASLATGAIASLIAVVVGTWAALALRAIGPPLRLVLDLIFFMPSAVPSVSVGLGLLVAFSQPPILLNGTTLIVIVAHFILVSAFSYGNISAGLKRLRADYEQVAASLGARPLYCLRHVTLPLILPYIVGAFSLSLALSMGELGATSMVYPPGWVTMPVGIFALTDRGAVFDASALTIVLIVVTLLVLLVLGRVSNRAAAR
ncbi:MAG TPA: ABC transporter permease subunit [Devosia sp.]|nr:ABC transporter permease subunit [Devosia sp.]